MHNGEPLAGMIDNVQETVGGDKQSHTRSVQCPLTRRVLWLASCAVWVLH